VNLAVQSSTDVARMADQLAVSPGIQSREIAAMPNQSNFILLAGPWSMMGSTGGSCCCSVPGWVSEPCSGSVVG